MSNNTTAKFGGRIVLQAFNGKKYRVKAFDGGDCQSCIAGEAAEDDTPIEADLALCHALCGSSPCSKSWELAGHDPTGIEAQVCEDIARRQALGIAKYGQTVAENPLKLREWLQHAYEETLDNAVYLRRAIDEIDKKTTTKT